eukprot:scaffold8161_cov111-Cylindrotheca_fusiformis.AAC.5
MANEEATCTRWNYLLGRTCHTFNVRSLASRYTSQRKLIIYRRALMNIPAKKCHGKSCDHLAPS